jgi:hypothetical protein
MNGNLYVSSVVTTCCGPAVLPSPPAAAVDPYLFVVLMLFGIGLLTLGVGSLIALNLDAPRENLRRMKR